MNAERTPIDAGYGWHAFTRAYNADRVGFLSALPATGPVVRMTANLVFVSDPALIETVFRATNTDFLLPLNRRLEPVDAGRGEAALEAWMNARRRAATSLRRTAAEGGDPAEEAELREQVRGWAAAGEATGVVEDLTRLNLRASVRLVAGRSDAGLEAGTRALLPSLVAVVDKGTRLPGPLALLSRRHRRARRLDDALLRRLEAMMAAAPESGPRGVLGELAGAGLDRATIANLAVALLLAGTLVPAAAGSWVLALLAAHPDWQDRVRGDAGATAWVVNEALRLYPPTWLISRTVARDGVWAGWRLRAGDELVISPYVSHRDPNVFPDPGEFRPERWAGGQPGFAEYFPFGAGARRCVAAEPALRRLTELVRQVTREGTRLTGSFPRSVSTTSTLFPADLRLGFADRLSRA
ncbi:cytochrome P450 [Streptomyces hoynatensis]|uniref:Cytochrome P450 n=1 Tax=Streptomyces hoynatensis TaxID=1141874 RepID=A0A3A9ZFV2_9ACTN|nr:cytochrome P450 [Streptomyces hoynatensis]RKN47015.1 cytochrome P450 [Streptomyces hoynatensis]